MTEEKPKETVDLYKLIMEELSLEKKIQLRDRLNDVIIRDQLSIAMESMNSLIGVLGIREKLTDEQLCAMKEIVIDNIYGTNQLTPVFDNGPDVEFLNRLYDLKHLSYLKHNYTLSIEEREELRSKCFAATYQINPEEQKNG